MRVKSADPPAANVSFWEVAVVSPHFTSMMKFSLTVPLFVMLTVTVTFWPMVTVVGDTETLVMVGAADTLTVTVRVWVNGPVLS